MDIAGGMVETVSAILDEVCFIEELGLDFEGVGAPGIAGPIVGES
jgi:hypothetical protein